MSPKPFVDNRSTELQHEYPRTHGDAFTEAAAENAGDRWTDPLSQHIKPYGEVAIAGIQRAEVLVPRADIAKSSNVTEMTAYRHRQ